MSRQGSVDEASLDGRNRDEATGNVDDRDPRRGDRDEWDNCGVNNCHMTLANDRCLRGGNTRACREKQERLRHSAEIIQYAELAERCPTTTRHLVTRVKQQRLPDSYEWQTCDLKLPNTRMAPYTKKYLLGTREAHEGQRG